MNLCIGVEIAKSAYIFNDTTAIFLIGKTARMYVNMPRKEEVT